MSPLRLSGSTSGYSQIDAPAIAGDQTFVLPSTGGTLTTTNGGQTIAHALGTAGAPSITFTNDINTGIYSPGADQVAISTNGNGRLFIDSSGNVGINTASAIAPGGFGYAREFALTGATSGDSPVAVNIRGSRTVAGGFGDINFWHQSTSNRAYIQARRGSSDSAIDLDFITSGGAGMRLDSTGKLGIGTTSPSNMLHIEGSSPSIRLKVTSGPRHMISPFSGDLYIEADPDNSSASTNLIFTVDGGEKARIDSSGRLLVGTSSTIDSDSNRRVHIAHTGPADICIGRSDGNADVDSRLGSLRFYSYAGSTWQAGALIEAVQDAASGNNDKPTRLVFSTTADGASSPTERMRITQAGKICMGNSASSQPETLQVYALDTVNGYCILANVAGTGTRTHIRFENGNGMVGAINTNGTSTSYNTSSDYRLKENVVPLTGAIDRVNQLQVRRFNFIADPSTTVDGFIAHEAQAVVPECVTGTKDEVDADGNPVYQGIDQSKLVPLLTAALQEALQKIEDLEGRLTAAGI